MRPAVVAQPKTAEPFYKSGDYLAWRTAVIDRAGGRCQWPGCGAPGRLFADHVVERRDGGDPLDPANGQALCAAHHNIKTARERRQRLGER